MNDYSSLYIVTHMSFQTCITSSGKHTKEDILKNASTTSDSIDKHWEIYQNIQSNMMASYQIRYRRN